MDKLHQATKHFISGSVAWILCLLSIFIVIPQLRNSIANETKAQKDSAFDFTNKKNQLDSLIKLSDKMRQGQDSLVRIQSLLPNMPSSQLQLSLSRELHKLSRVHNVRLQSVKYARPSREGQKNTELESIESEFVTTGIYSDLRAFMLSLETAGLPYAVREARLEESPEGLKLTVNLRAFKKPDVLFREGNQ